MEYINIISKEEIIAASHLPITVVGCLVIAAVLSSYIYWGIVKDPNKVIKYLGVVGSIGISCLMIAIIICSTFFQIPTGRYRYEATIDKDKITVAQYEEFIEKYNPTIKDEIYYWEE